MKIRIYLMIFLCLAFIIQLSEIVKADENIRQKCFAAKMITKDGKVYQSLKLSTDWKDITHFSKCDDEKSIKNSALGVEDITIFSECNILKIDVNSSYKSKAICKLFNLAGEQIAEWDININKGVNTYSKNVYNLPSGIYFLLIIDQTNQSSAKKIILQ